MAEDEREQRLRKKAEKLVGADLASLEDLTPDQMRGLIHDLQVQQIELQMQNEELRQAQAELERSRNRYFELYDLAPVAYLTVDQEGVILQANLRAGDLLGHQRSHLVRRKFTDFVVISDRASWIAHLQTVTESGERRFCELNLMRRDGAVVTVHLDTVRVGDDENEKPFELGTSMTEITQRKEAEEALREAHERAKWMARFPEENPNPVARASADGIVLYRNPAAAELAGWACEIGKPLPEFLLPIVARGMAVEEDAQQNVQLGGRFYSVWVAPFPRESYANVYGRDITDRKQAEEALRQLNAELEQRVAEQTAEIRRTYEAVTMERQRLYDVLETLPAYVVLLTPDYHVPFANRFFRERFGESHGQRCFEYLFGRTEPCEICDTYKVLKTNAPHHWEWTGPDGRNYDIFDFPFTDTDGSPLIMEMGIDITERKLAEEELRKAHTTLEARVEERTAALAAARNEVISEKNRLEAVMEALPVGVAIIDARGGNIRSNDMFKKVWGSPRPAAQEVSDYKAHKAWWVNTGKPVQPEEWASARAVQKGETVIGQVIEIESFDGVRKFIMNSAAPVYDAAGKIVGSAVAIQDITERVRAEQALRENQADLNRAQAVAHTGSWRLDVRRNELLWSDENHRIFGIPRGTPMTYETFLGTVHPDDRAYVHEKWTAGLRGESYDVEHRIVVGDTVKWVRERAELEFDNKGLLLGGFGTTQDVTERKQAKQALEHSVRRFELLAETASELLQTPEPQKVVDSVCPRVMEHLDCHAFFNFLVDEKAGRLRLNACAGIPPEEARRIEWLDYGVAVCGCVARDHCRIVAEHIPTTPDVRTELVKSYGIKAYACHPLLGAGGRLIGTLSFGTRTRETFSPDDLSLMKAVTDQVAAAMIRTQGEQALRESEEALRQANEQLEEKVRERTAELRALTENLMESRYQLRSLASDLIVTEARERRALASDLHDTLAQMLALAKLRLEFAGLRLEGAPAEEVRKVVPLIQQAIVQTRSLMADLSPALLYEAGLEKALRALARRMGELHSLTIEVVDDGNPKPLGEDYRVLLFRAVQELLHNVVKHAKVTRAKVSLHREGEQVRIEVEDDGVGFDAQECNSHVWRGGEGGFGLFSIQERMQHLGGNFKVFSQRGRGVRAVLLAPLQVEGEDEGRERAAVRILIAEDHQIMRDALADILNKEPGFEVVGLAADGLEAVRVAHEAKPDVVLMDINMPVMDGIEATRQVQRALPEVKVIGFSVHTDDQIVSQMLAAGASSVVVKTSSPEELTEAIRTAVRTGIPASGPQG